MASDYNITAMITLGGEGEFRKSITSATNSLKEISSESKLVNEQFQGQQNTMEALRAQHEVLEKSVAAHKEKEEALSKALENAKKNQEAINNNLPKLLGQWDEERSKLEELKKIYGESSNEVKEQEKKVKELSDAIKQGERNYETAGNRIQRWQTQLNNAQVETLRANRALEQNEQYLREAEHAADGCARSIDNFGNRVRESTNEVKDLSEQDIDWKDKLASAAVTKGFSAAADALGRVKDKAVEAAKYVIEVGSAFEAGMSEVAAISGAASSDLKNLTEKAKELGATTKFTATEAADAFKYMSLAGWSTSQMLSGVDGILNLAAASGMELASASDMVTDYLSAFNMEAEKSTYMADMLAHAQANSNTTAEQLGEAYGNCAANLNTAGQDIETVTAFLEAMANQGLKGSEAGTALGSVMTQITQKMEDGKIKIGEMFVTVADSKGNFRDLTDIIKDVGGALEGMGTEERSAALAATFNKTALSGLNLILNEGMDKVSSYEDALRDADGTAAEMADTMQNNLTGDLTKAGSALEGLGIAAYDYVEGPVRDVVQGVTDAISWITDAIEPQKDMLDDFIDSVAESNETIENALERSSDTFRRAQDDAAKIELYKQKILELNDVQGKNQLQRYEMERMVSELSERIPQLSEAYDSEKAKINLTSEAIEALMENEKAYILQEAGLKAKQEAMDALLEAEINVAKAGEAIKRASDEKDGEKVNEAIKAKEKAIKLQEEARENYELTDAAVDTATEKLGEYTDKLDEMGLSAEKAAEETESYVESTDNIIVSSEAQENALQSLKEKFEEIKSSIEQSMNVNMFEKFDGGDTYDIDKLIENLKEQRKALADWEANMQTLAGEIGENMNTELFDKLLEMGPDQGANFAQQLVNTLNNEGGSKMKELAEQWAGALSDRETYANSLARTQSIIKTIMGEMSNSTELDFSNLRESLEGAASAAAEGGEAISKELKSSFLQTVEAAKKIGAEIPEGLADKIASGEVSVGDAIAQLKGSMEAQFNFLSELAGEAGIEIPDEIRQGISNGGEEAVQAIAKLQSKILKEQEKSEKEFKKGGKKNTEAVGAGSEEAKSEVVSKTGGVMQESANTANSYYMQFRNVGSNMMSGVALGMTSNSNLVYDAVRRILEQAKKEADKATDSRSPSRVWRNQVGAYMSQGLALGIFDGTKDVTSAAAGLAQSATKAAKEELDINSPSKIFIKLGGYISEGLGVGIKNKKGYAVQTSKKMAKEVYKASAEWMEKYMDSHNVSLKAEKKFWKQLAKTVKKDGESYKKALKNAAANDKFTKEVREKVKDAFDVSWYTKKAKKTVKKDTDKYYSEVTKAAKKFIDNKKAVDGTGLRQERYFWEQVQKKVGKGTQTYADAAKRIKEINKDIRKQIKANSESKQEKKEYGVSGAGLELYKSLYKVSAQAEIDYWKKIRKNGKLTKAQKLEVDKNILEAEENFNEQMKALKDDYYEKCEDINDKLKDDIKELTEEYETAFADRKSAIKSAFGTFDEFSSEAEAPETLLENMKSQAAGYALWMEQLGELEGKGILKSPFIEELRQMGPEAAATIMSLNMMTEEQLRQAQQAWDEKDRLAEAQAAKETEALRKKNEEQIKTLRDEAQKQLDTYKTEYETASAELSAAMSAPLEELAEKATSLGEAATAELILGMKGKAESKAAKKELKEVRKQVASGLNGLPKKGKDIGGDMLAGLLSGLSNKLAITKGAKSFVEELETAIKAAAGIHSPSRRFRDTVGKQIPAGVAQGVEEGTAEAERAGAGMVDSMLAKSAERMERQRTALKGYVDGINSSAGIAALDSLTAPHLTQAANITVNNTGVAEMLGGVTAEIQKLGGEIRRMKIMLDTGELVGAIGSELAMEARRA